MSACFRIRVYRSCPVAPELSPHRELLTPELHGRHEAAPLRGFFAISAANRDSSRSRRLCCSRPNRFRTDGVPASRNFLEWCIAVTELSHSIRTVSNSRILSAISAMSSSETVTQCASSGLAAQQLRLAKETRSMNIASFPFDAQLLIKSAKYPSPFLSNRDSSSDSAAWMVSFMFSSIAYRASAQKVFASR